MATNLSRYEEELDALILRADKMWEDLLATKKAMKANKSKDPNEFEKSYQGWYTEACEVIRQIIPNRIEEFELLYQGNGKRKSITRETYTVRDWLLGSRAPIDSIYGKRDFRDFEIMAMQFNAQREILKSAKRRFTSSLFDIRQIVRADIFDSELDGAKELLKNGFLRAAGAIAGVVAEKHLQEVCSNRGLSVKKANPTINILNETLKGNDIIDTPSWLFIQRIGALRNLCDHQKDREPTNEEVKELIDDVEKITKTIF